VVEGDDGYRQAKDFMKLLMPSHAAKVKQYADPVRCSSAMASKISSRRCTTRSCS
jgi:Ribonuclease G/E